MRELAAALQIHTPTPQNLQFVADRLFPYQVAANAAVRREFLLTEHRPFAG